MIKIELYTQIFVIFTLIVLWVIYAYYDERLKKIQFVNNFRKSKEYTKLNQIINILVPSLVRDRI